MVQIKVALWHTLPKNKATHNSNVEEKGFSQEEIGLIDRKGSARVNSREFKRNKDGRSGKYIPDLVERLRVL